MLAPYLLSNMHCMTAIDIDDDKHPSSDNKQPPNKYTPVKSPISVNEISAIIAIEVLRSSIEISPSGACLFFSWRVSLYIRIWTPSGGECGLNYKQVYGCGLSHLLLKDHEHQNGKLASPKSQREKIIYSIAFVVPVIHAHHVRFMRVM